MNDIDRIHVVDAYFRGHDNHIVSGDVVTWRPQSVPMGVREIWIGFFSSSLFGLCFLKRFSPCQELINAPGILDP